MPSSIDPDSEAYQCIGKRCVFCREIITKKDVTKPNKVMESKETDKTAHNDCLAYCMKKYPNVSIAALEGKIERHKIEFTRNY